MEPMTFSMTATQAAQAIAACERLETGLRTTATRARQAIQEAARELQRMVAMINADRAGRGQPPLDVEINGGQQ